MTISVNLTDTPVGVTVSANAGSVSVSAATVTAVQVGIGDTFIPATHGGTHAGTGSDPITVGTVSGRFVVTTTDGRLTTQQYVNLSQIVNGMGTAATSLDQMISDVASYGNPYTISGSGTMQPVAHVHDTADITSGTLATARLGSGTASTSTYLRGDQTWAAISTYTLPAATTSTLGGVIVGTGLGVTSGTVSVTYGTASGTSCQGNDSRLSDARTPTGAAGGDLTGTFPNPTLAASGATAGTYKSVTVDAKGRVTSGSNPTTLAGYGITDAASSTHIHAASDITTGTLATARLASGTASASTYLRGDQTWATVSSYTLPSATTSSLGGVIVGTGLSVSSGTVSANVVSVAGRTGTVTIAHSDVGNAPETLTQFTAAQNNLSLGTGGIVRISSNAAVNITGFAATSGGDARMLSNVGSFAITLKHSDAASTAANRILCVGNADVVIAAGGSAVVYYDATDSRWRVG